MEKTKKLEYFLGANTPNGFLSFYDNLIDLKSCKHFYIIKGGPGSGKSTLMRAIAQKSLDLGFETHIIRCSGDPDSLDGVYIPSLKIAIADGTAPHVIEPKFPGAVDSIVDMSVCWDMQALKNNRAEIIDASARYKAYYDAAYRFLAAAGKVENDIYSAVISNVDFDKIATFCHRFIKKHSLQKGRAEGSKRVIVSPTCLGMYDLKKSLADYAKKCVIVTDFCGVGGVILSTLRDIALSEGIDTDVYYSGMNIKNGVEALYFKESGICVILSTLYSPFSLENVRSIRAVRFIGGSVADKKTRISNDKRMLFALMEEAQLALQNAKRLHDALEQPYTCAMNFEKAELIKNKLITEIFSL